MIDNLKELYEAEKLNKVKKKSFLKKAYFLQSYFKIFVLIKKRRRLQVTKQHDQYIQTNTIKSKAFFFKDNNSLFEIDLELLLFKFLKSAFTLRPLH